MTKITDVLIDQIETMDVKPTESIVITFNMNEITTDELKQIYYLIQSKYPTHTIIALPDGASIQSAGKDLLIKFRDMLNEVINNGMD